MLHVLSVEMSNCPDALREDVLFAGHCGAVSGILSCSAASEQQLCRNWSNNSSDFIRGVKLRYASDSRPFVSVRVVSRSTETVKHYYNFFLLLTCPPEE